MPFPPEQKPGDDSRRLWRAFNQLRDFSRQLERRVLSVENTAAQRARLDYVFGLAPFTVFPRPLYEYTPAEREEVDDSDVPLSERWWRIFRVRHGYADAIKCEGCDDTDDEGVTPIDFIVPAECAIFWIWCDFTNPSAPEMKGSTFVGTTPTHWTGYAVNTKPPAGIRPVARIRTTGGAKQARVWQMQQGNIWPQWQRRQSHLAPLKWQTNAQHFSPLASMQRRSA